MCGIVGIVSSTPWRERGLLDVMRDTLRHRGPDSAGTWWSGDARVGLAHRRLAILDLTPGGHQPMQSPDGNCTLIYNGEIYNHAELRQELQSRGVRFHSTSDTEVLLEAYRMWGTDCLTRLEGMFAFALHDASKDLLFLARDRAGEKPLYYFHDSVRGVFYFASELKAILADPSVPRRVNLEALNHYLAYGYVPGELCMLEGFEKLTQGTAMTLRAGRCEERNIWRYWQLPESSPDPSAEAEELVERLHELLRESVRRQLVADVPVGILLSGGIDSSLVTAMAAEVSNAPVKTFTISFPGHGAFDEGPYARRVAEHFGAEHTELVTEPATVELLPQLAKQFDEPMADSSMVPTYLVSRAIREHATVALGGDGGDELFGGYQPHQWIQQMQALRRFVPRGLRRPFRTILERWIPLGRFGRNFLLGLLSDLPGSITQINTYFDPSFRSRLLNTSLGSKLTAPEAYKHDNQRGADSAIRRITAMDFRTFLVDDILVKVDRASMMTSLEVRAPFLAPKIINFAFRDVPDPLRATRQGKKILLRRLAGRLLPEEMDLTRKQGFMLPLQDWFRGPWGEFCREVLLQAEDSPFRPDVVNTLLQEQRQGYRHTQRLFALTMFELWRREYKVRLPLDSLLGAREAGV